MIWFLVRRLTSATLVIFLVTVTVFFVGRVIGDPVEQMVSDFATEEDRDALREQLGLDRPLDEQFFDFIGGVSRLDFGDSLRQSRPASTVVLERLPATFKLMTTSIVLALVVFVPFGIVAATRPGGALDRFLVSVSLLGVSMPQFWVAQIFILVLTVQLGWLPTSGSGSWQHLILPATTLALTSGSRIAQIARTSVLDQLTEPYVTTARAKGFGSSYVLRRHVLRNALVPIVTVAGWEFAQSLASSAVVVETVFAWPGMGRLAIQAIEARDFVVMQAVVFVVAIIVVTVNLMTDLVYKLIDARIRLA